MTRKPPVPPWRRWRALRLAGEADGVKRPLPKRRIVLAGPKAAPKWAIFDCPCGTGHEIMLNLNPQRRPHWRVRTGLLRCVTVSPSVDSTHEDMRCHYFIRRGRVEWT
jgi:Family of unknown function (DUF6527)